MNGVDLWIDGHDHTFQRSKQISNQAGACSISLELCCNMRGHYFHKSYSKGMGTIVNIIGTGGQTNGGIQSTPPGNMFAAFAATRPKGPRAASVQ